MPERKKSLLFLLILALGLTITQASLAAEKKIAVFLSGSEINFEVPPQIISDRVMVPLRQTIEEITGSEMQWDEATKTVTFEANGKTCTHVIGEAVGYVDGVKVDFGAPSQIIGSRTLVPVRAISEMSGLLVNWEPEALQVLITKPPAKPEGISLDYDVYNVTCDELEDAPDSPNYIGSYMVPYITGLGDSEFEEAVNKRLLDEIELSAGAFEEEYNALLAIAKAEKDPEEKKLLIEMLEPYEYASDIQLVTISDGYIAIREMRYENRGGAHPLTGVVTYNIDTAGKKFLTLDDIFNSKEYKPVIEKKLVEMAKTDKYQELLFPDAQVTLNNSSFYLAMDKLVIFYQPYELGSYAAGYIVFELPLSDLSDILKEEYLNADYSDVLKSADIFQMDFTAPLA